MSIINASVNNFPDLSGDFNLLYKDETQNKVNKVDLKSGGVVKSSFCDVLGSLVNKVYSVFLCIFNFIGSLFCVNKARAQGLVNNKIFLPQESEVFYDFPDAKDSILPQNELMRKSQGGPEDDVFYDAREVDPLGLINQLEPWLQRKYAGQEIRQEEMPAEVRNLYWGFDRINSERGHLLMTNVKKLLADQYLRIDPFTPELQMLFVALNSVSMTGEISQVAELSKMLINHSMGVQEITKIVSGVNNIEAKDRSAVVGKITSNWLGKNPRAPAHAIVDQMHKIWRTDKTFK